ncbi:MAG: beta-lactamase family protein, partial [Gemmatimonadales bacterium]|nr:beta-lactamase family protein [Gemmatimonadales bacterium]
MTASFRRELVAALMLTIPAAPSAAQTYAQVDQAALAGIREGLYPGAVVVIGRRDSILYSRGYGHFTWNPSSSVPRPDSTLWDIASITKVVATASSAMRLVDQGKLDLDAPVGRYLPRFSGGLKNQVTVRMLLDHTSGLKTYVPIYRRAGRSRSRMISLLYAQPLVRAPGDSAAYSDLNAMLLGLVIESVARTPLDRFADTEVFDPLGMGQTRFRLPARLKRRTAPSGIWRGQPVP